MSRFSLVKAAGIALAALPLAAQVNVLTYQYDDTRAGANRNEVLLTTSNVNQNQFGKLFSYPVDGFLYGQPLYLGGVNIPGKGVHNVVFVATEHDSVYAFDADSNAGANAAPLWKVSFLGANVTTVPASDVSCGQISPEIGITSTPVIDPATGTIYVVAMTKESGSYFHRLHALDMTTGAEKPGSPVTVQATYPGNGEGGNTLVFAPKNYKQRPGLLLLNGVVYTAWSSHCDLGLYHGWLIGYDSQTLRQVSVYNNTPNGNEASFWAGGAAPAVDQNGSIFLVAGNGSFDAPSGGPNLGEAYSKLLPAANGFVVQDYFAPFNASSLNTRDLDVGSSGVALLGDEAGSAEHPHLLVGAGKEGRIYLLDRDNMGKWQSGSDSQIVQSIPNGIGGLFGNPAYFNKTIYLCGSGDRLKAFSISNARMSATPASQSGTSFGSPGCVPSISANGNANGIVWLLESSGALHALDATDVSHELYSSKQNSSRDALGGYVKFSVPTIANGRVYAGTQGALVVYGLLGVARLGVGNAASGEANIAAPGSLISIYGTGLDKTTVRVSGVAAPVLFSSAAQVNAQVPFEAALGPASLTVSSGDTVTGSASLTLQRTAPGLFLLGNGRAAVLNQDYSVNSTSQPAVVGSVIAAYLTGLGAVNPPVATGAAAPLNALSTTAAVVTATIGGKDAAVKFSGLAPGFIGLYQVNILVPALAPGDYPLQVSADGVAGNAAAISVR